MKTFGPGTIAKLIAFDLLVPVRVTHVTDKSWSKVGHSTHCSIEAALTKAVGDYTAGQVVVANALHIVPEGCLRIRPRRPVSLGGYRWKEAA